MTALALPKVLTVEDDPIVRADLRLILEDAGFDVVPDARDGVEAVDRAREHAPDLILMDLALPRVDGVEATRRILGERDVPIVALTGHGGESLERAVDAGASGHVVKPFSEAQLVGTVLAVLTEHGDRGAEQAHLRSMVETMLRNGSSEREIVRAVEQASSRAESVSAARPLLRRLVETARSALRRRRV